MTLWIIAIVALLLGLAIGWLLRAGAVAAATARGDAAALQANELPPLRLMLDGVREERDVARRALAVSDEKATRAAMLEQALAAERARAGDLAAEKAAFLRGEAERADAHAAQLAQIKEMEAKLEVRFGDMATKALGEAQGLFLKRADERFRQSEEKSGDQLKALLQPVSERLQRYEEGVAKVEAERRDAFGNLTGLIESMRVGQEKVSSEAAKLVNSLRAAPKARGNWGEQQLKNVLESCGLSEHCDFATEVSVESEDGRFRPDVVVKVPGGRTLVIDSKVSLNAYQDAYGAVDEKERVLHLNAHAEAMKAHVNTLGSKAYQTRFADTADYVIMFVPGEHFLSAALDQMPRIWDFAFEKRVLLATPTNLIAIARTVAAVWRQERLATDARHIAELGKELHDRLSKAAGDLRKVGGGLTSAVNNYNAFVASFETRVLVSGRKFRDLNVDTGGREIEHVVPVEALARGGAEALLPPASNDQIAEAAE